MPTKPGKNEPDVGRAQWTTKLILCERGKHALVETTDRAAVRI